MIKKDFLQITKCDALGKLQIETVYNKYKETSYYISR